MVSVYNFYKSRTLHFFGRTLHFPSRTLHFFGRTLHFYKRMNGRSLFYRNNNIHPGSQSYESKKVNFNGFHFASY